ncbi:MAG: helix-turn-helix domain-containing protein [Verrucomicrobiales bacterium]|nr:helix-turn-helix domain-containing protein [Verrucomicrobiales bacterium]
MTSEHSSLSESEKIYQKLIDSDLYRTYKKAFHDAIGMDLSLMPADEDTPRQESPHFANLFCETLNRGGSGCDHCKSANQCLRSSAGEQARTSICFARMRETAIPIKSANRPIAFLCTGQIFTEKPKKKDFAKVAVHLEREGRSAEEIAKLQKKWLEIPVMSVEKYQGIVTMLAAFALQLSEVLNRLMIEEENSEPEIVSRARQYICANLENKVNLEDVARRVGVSTYYFCKVFKASTGITLTEYVNRRRVEWAKRKLLNPRARITEVAFDVGYQSLSQFNRSFLKYVGVSPTRFREQQASKSESSFAIAA